MTTKRVVKAKEIIQAIREGRSAAELMQNYQFSPKDLRTVFRKLLDFDVMSKSELEERGRLYDCPDESGLRQTPRKRLEFPMKIFEGGNPFSSGLIKDISERGVCIQGIKSLPGETKTFVVSSGWLSGTGTVIFEAKCRWVSNERNPPQAGYEIVNISVLDAKALKKLIPG